MKLSFSWKVGLISCLLSVCLTSLGVYYFYSMTYRMTMEQLAKNLRDFGNVGALLFDQDAREAIKRLKAKVLIDANLDRENILNLPAGEVISSLSPAKIKEVHASADFKLLLQRLKMLAHASYKEVTPLLEDYEFEVIAGFEQGGIGTYLMFNLPEYSSHDIGMYLVSCAPEPTADGWPGNPAGIVFRSFVPWSKFNQKIYIYPELVTDSFYKSLSGSVPILDKEGQTIAVLGLDYSVGSQLAKLDRLSMICFGLIAASLIFSALLSVFISRRLNAPLRQLHDAAQKVSQSDYAVSVAIKSNDEFGLLGQVFNQMLSHIRRSFETLEFKNRQLSAVVSDLHDGVGAILTNIALTSRRGLKADPEEVLPPIDRLARHGLSEVRFLMDALEYEECDLSVVAEEVELLAADILKPSDVTLDLNLQKMTPQQQIEFAVFLDLQRLFREAFTNIVKHSGADRCQVDIDMNITTCLFRIKDNGGKFVEKEPGVGRGLASMAGRIERRDGTFTYGFTDGFQIEFSLPYQALLRPENSAYP